MQQLIGYKLEVARQIKELKIAIPHCVFCEEIKQISLYYERLLAHNTQSENIDSLE